MCSPNMTEEFYQNLKHNHFFHSKIKKMEAPQRNAFIYNNIKSIYHDIFYQFNCPFSEAVIEYKIHVFYNKVNMDFILYFTKNRYYTNSKYLSKGYDYFSHIEKTYYNVPISKLEHKLESFIKILKRKPYVKKDTIFILEPIIQKCTHRINMTKKKLHRVLNHLPLNKDCNEIVISHLV